MKIPQSITDDLLILNRILATAPDIQESFIDSLLSKGLLNGRILLAFYNPLLRNNDFLKSGELNFNKFSCQLKY